MDVIAKLKDLNLPLPSVSEPGGNYESINIRQNQVFVAIQFPILNGEFLFQGKLGSTLSNEEGYKGMQLCALNILSQIHHKIGFENILGLNHMDAYYRGVDGWDESPKIVNGASDLFLNVLGEKGKHSRAIIGVEHLPREFAMGITSSFTLL